MRRGDRCASRERQRGVSYAAMLFAVAVIGVMLMEFGTMWSALLRRDREAELLFRGNEIRRALESYSRSGPVTGMRPKTLDELLQDTRAPVVQRHLRRLYADPLTGKPDWVLVHEPSGGIIAVHSRAIGTPMKQAGFDKDDEGFERAASYADWVFRGSLTPAR